MSTATTDLEACLHERFGLDQFRPGQREVIETVLAGRDCLCVMPTGGGKSLCYQLPSLVQDGVTLVVSPLIALMKDQVDALVARGIRATLINSTLDPAEQNERIAATERGEFDLVYVAPERFRSHRFSEAIARTKVALLAVDEAHCISEWGHDFRPDYTRLGAARKRLGNPPTIALTATATDHVRRDIIEQLEFTEPQVFITGFDRPNLRYEVRFASGDTSKHEALAEVLNETPGAGIVYCASRKKCEEVAEFLRGEGRRKCVIYHGGMDRDERHAAQERFMGGKDLVVAATNAFGMGVDKSDIRFVLHYNIPGTIEAYYQEAGRAGRDGAESRCVLLYSPSDRYIQEYFIDSEYPPREVVGRIYQFLAKQDADPIELTQAEIKERLDLDISEMGVGASLKLLEAAGALERLRPRENMAIIRIDAEASLVGLLPEQAKNQRKVLSALERLVASSQGDETYFNPHFLCQRLELEPPQFSRAVHELCEKLPVEYVPPFRGNAVRMFDRERKLDALGIDFDALQVRKQREYDKLDRVIQYATSATCRRETILHYFGDTNPVQCGHCDVCSTRASRAERPVKTTERTTEIVRKILAGIARTCTRMPFGCGKRLVAGMLVGKKTKQILKFGLDKLTTYGLLDEFAEDDVVQLIDNLVAAGWVNQTEPERFRPVIDLTEPGREVMMGKREAVCAWRLPAELSARLHGAQGKRESESREIDHDLLRQLREARTSWAAESNLLPFQVFHDSVLESLARARPATLDSLLLVKGIGSNKAAKYGERLLTILGGEPLPKASASKARAERTQSAADRVRDEPARRVGPPDYHWTWRLLEKGFTQIECAEIRGIDEDTVLEHALEAARAGQAVPLDAFLPSEFVEQIDALLEDAPAGVSGASLPFEVTPEHIELVRLRCRPSS